MRASSEDFPPRYAGTPMGALALQKELRDGRLEVLQAHNWGERHIEVALGLDSLWLLVRQPNSGGLALRTAYAPGGLHAEMVRVTPETWTIQCRSALGLHEVSLKLDEHDLIRAVTTLTPAQNVSAPYLPRDLYPLDSDDSVLGAHGTVQAAQRGVNAGLLYFCLNQPAFGQVLYFQDLTALNTYFEATETTPDGVVGGEWPELGYQPPTVLGNSPPTRSLPAGRPVILSAVHLCVRDQCAPEEQTSAWLFLDMLAQVYRGLTKPATDFRNWPQRARSTLHDLSRSKKATIKHYGHTYVHPYVGAEYPDSMVQISVLTALHDYAKWSGRKTPLEAKLRAGLHKFFDPALGVVRRYLPNVGADKNRFAVDSWYLYHPLMNLGRLAKDGDEVARKLFYGSLDYAIKAARRFKYKWPIQYDVRNFKVLVPARDDRGLGQTDVGGIYAYLMLQAFDLTGERRYVREAAKALRAGQGLRFEIVYQANLTAWGAVAALRLWRITGDDWFRRQSHVYLAGLFHNSEIWESEIKNARHFRNFLGLTCLHDAPYMALYECFESFAALDEYVEIAGLDIENSLALLLSEYSRYGLDRAWFYYPDALPPDALATDIRNGSIDPRLSFPLEDLYGDGQPCGQVGQEIYGCGAAFVYASRRFIRDPALPFDIFCDRRIMNLARAGDGSIVLHLDIPLGCAARLAIVRRDQAMPGSVEVLTSSGPSLPLLTADDRTEFEAPLDTADVTISWC